MNIAILLSGGRGERIQSDVPKQYISIEEKMIITRTIEHMFESPMVHAVQIVAEKEWWKAIGTEMKRCFSEKEMSLFRGFSVPGENRQLSIWSGLCDIKEYAQENDTVIIFDAARPCVSREQIETCITLCRDHDGAMPALPVKDTVYLSKDGCRVSGLLDRSSVFAGQAPEAFHFGKYRKANEELLPDRIREIHGSTETAILGKMDVAMFPGDERNFKITTDEDLNRYRELVKREERRGVEV